MEKKLSKEEIKSKVIGIAAEKYDIRCEDIHSDSNFVSDLGADSLDLVEMIMTMEKVFGVVIPDTDSQQFKTVGEVIDYLDRKLNTQE